MRAGSLGAAIRIAREAGAYLLRNYRKVRNVGHKRRITDLVTEIDRGSEELIVRRLRKAFPGDDIVAEEKEQEQSGADRRWYVDPLDGTVNYVHGFPIYSVSMALVEKGRARLGVVYLPHMNELFTAVRGRGAKRNGRRIRVSKRRRLADSLLATGFPYYDSGRRKNLRYFKSFLHNTRAVRRAGSAAIDLAYTACGIFDGFWEFGLKAWDIAAGALMVEEAGGRVTRFDGSALEVEKGEILATNGFLHRPMMRVLRKSS